MKLNIVPARTGIVWVKLGIQTFFRQPLALSGLFFMFMAVMSVATLLPLIGNALALALLPACTLGLMAATQEATKGKFPMPSILISAFRAGQQRMQAMLVLGALYAAGFLLVMGISALIDGGEFAKLYLVGGKLTREKAMAPEFQAAMWVAMGLYLPLSLLFWHAPALVHWHGVPPVKSLFFSAVACMRNFWAFTVFGLVWVAVFVIVGMVVTTLAAVIGSPVAASVTMVPAAMLMAAMFFTSLYFTFRDSFEAAPDPQP
ncbi:MAG TPA: BPSS1780 family membrane protein [Burkholderiaceae bacterium]|nr:BPSS1780 family membrane protein [Burkholderiaceae bacterium]